MNKIFTLIRNEYLKSIKKISTKIMIILAILTIFLAVGLSKLMKFENEYFAGEMLGSESWQDQLNQEIQLQKKELESQTSPIEKASIQANIEADELALKNNVNINMTSGWKSRCIAEIESQKSELYLLEKGTEEYNTLNTEIEKNIKALQEDDYNAYVIDSEIEEIKKQLADEEISQEEYNDRLEIIEIKKKYEIGRENNEENSWKETIVEELETIKESIRMGIDVNSGKVLSVDKLEELKETEKIDLYRLEKNMAPIDTMTNYRSFYDYTSAQLSMFMVAILAIILAGSAISTEISKGTIKFWVMTPNKRWKILFAKLINIILIIVCTTVLLACISELVGTIFFKEAPQPYLYLQNGEVQELNSTVYKILNFLTYDIDILVYTTLALMLSTVIRNTALSIGISVALFTGGSFAMQMVNMFVKADWLKYVPMNNMGLTDKIFSNSISYSTAMMTEEFANNVSLQFSLCVLAVTVFLMIVTTFDSFNKRDIL